MNTEARSDARSHASAPAEPVAIPADAPPGDPLAALGRYLRDIGYAHVAVTPLTHAHHNARRARAATEARPFSTEARLRDIFGWSLPFARASVSPWEFALMEEAGVLEPLAPEGDGEPLWRSTVRWASLPKGAADAASAAGDGAEYLCAHSAFPTEDEDSVFFGPDTYRFARFLRSRLTEGSRNNRAAHVRRAVDIGCGSGAGALILAEACPGAEVLGVDINPRALRLTRANAELAGARITAARSDLLDDVDGLFDRIIANPPYMLDAGQRTYRHGGGELGEGLALRIVETALRRLAPGGALLLYTGVAVVDGRDPLRAWLDKTLRGRAEISWTYEEIDPDVFQDELLKPAYARVERIAAVGLSLTRGI